jgi:intracellular sulfur oxidation DsrE/DsrF family protein
MDINGPNRRTFLGAAALASTALATAALSDTQAAHAAAQGDWDLSWATRIGRAKHRVIFDSTEIESGTALMNALLCLRDYGSVYKATDGDMGLVIVVRHIALPMVFNDEMWARLKMGVFTKIKDPITSEDAVRNPFVNVKPGDKTVLYDTGAALDTLIGRGVTVLCCNMALLHFADMLTKAANISADEAHKQLAANLIPGTILMPSGIFAAARAQEAGCHYIRST